MANQKGTSKAPAPKKETDKIEWFGIDGALCLLYVIEAIGIGACVIGNMEGFVGKFVPYFVALVTTAIFIKYISEVFSFSKKSKD